MDTNLRPKVSILICTYNRSHTIQKALDSALTQTFSDYEILILDDASTDNTEVIIKPYLNNNSIKYFRHDKNMGIANNRNYGLNNSLGEYIAVLDSDDIWIDINKLKKQVSFLEDNKDFSIIGTNIESVDEKDILIKKYNFETSDLRIRNKMLLQNQIAQSSVVYRKDIALEFGGYNSDYVICDDYDLWLKIGTKSKISNLPDYTVKYLDHSQGISKSKKLLAAIEHKKIIYKYKDKYPNYLLALMKSYLRILKAFI